jgi:hypothetical protein
MKAEVNEENVDETGKITFHLSHEGFKPEAAKLDNYAISLRVDNNDYGVHVASEYVQTALHKVSVVSVKMNAIYKANSVTKVADKAFDISDIEPEMTKEIEYTDGIAYAFFAGLELGAELIENNVSKGIFTFSQLKTMGYDMPTPTTTATCIAGDCEDIVNDLTKGVASTVSVRIMNGTVENMKSTKGNIGKNKVYNFAFNDGLGEAADNTVNAQLKVSIGKHKSALSFKFPYETVWTYALDAANDHANISSWAANYTRPNFAVKPTLTLSDGDFELDGSNKVYGLEVSDFNNKIFNLPASYSEDIVINFNIADGAYDLTEKTVTLNNIAFKTRLGSTYTVTGSYPMGKYLADEVAAVTAVVTVKTTDRNTDVINITAPAYDVTLLKSGEYVSDSGDGYYKITSNDFSDALVDAYVNQGIFTKSGEVITPSKATAFATGEFIAANIVPSPVGTAKSFEVVTDVAGTFDIKSKDLGTDLLTSAILHKIASNYENETWSYSFKTYVGQEVKITWPIKAVPMYEYKLKTYDLNTTDYSFSIPDSKVWPDHANITKAKTELDLINDSNILVVEGNTTVPANQLASKHLAPKFTLVGSPVGVIITNTNVEYYGPEASVGIKGSLDIVSGTTPFLVQGSEKIYVNNTSSTTDVVYVKQFNPIADPAGTTESVTIKQSVPKDIPVTMKDILGNKLYVDGVMTTSEANYKEEVPVIFGAINFSVYSVNGSPTTTGWSFADSSSPANVQLQATTGVATGTYTVVVRASTCWKTYDYTFLVTVTE